MKKNLLLSLFIIWGITIFAQVPQAFNYQAVLRNSAGEIIANRTIALRLSIVATAVDGTVVYSERQVTDTNPYGLVSLSLGKGSILSGDFSAIDWRNDVYFIKVELDEHGGSDYVDFGTRQLLSVPYALHAATSGSVPDMDTDPENEIQELTISGNDLTITDGNTITLPEVVIPSNSVSSENIVNGEVKTEDLANNSVNSLKIVDGSVEFSDIAENAIQGLNILNGTISNEDINADANIDISKILGASGISWSLPNAERNWSNGQYHMQTITSITMTFPKPGYLLLIHSGHIGFFGTNRVMEVGIGYNETAFARHIRAGFLDGSDTNRYILPYCVTMGRMVGSGTHTFYALAQGESSFSNRNCYVLGNAFIGVFIPLLY